MRVSFAGVLVAVILLAGFVAVQPRTYGKWRSRIFRVPDERAADQDNDGERRVAAIIIFVASIIMLFMQFR